MINRNTWACKTCTVDTTGLDIVPVAPVQTEKVQDTTAVLPPADYLVITWTEAETDALAKVLSRGQYKFYGLTPAENNFVPLRIDITKLPLPNHLELTAHDVQCHAFYFVTKVNGKSVICLKSNFHPKKEKSGNKYGGPLHDFIGWLVKNNNFKYIMTTGTSGCIWSSLDLGDVIVCNSARYDPNEQALKDAGKPTAVFTSGVGLAGTLTGGKSQFDIMSGNLSVYAQCAITKMKPERKPANGAPRIYYKPSAAGEPNTVISDIAFTAERDNIDNKNYASMGATFDNNDAFVAEACKSAGYTNWVSIRNISDVPGAGSDSTYDKYQDCSSIIGGLAIYAFIAGH
ncbi:MAG: hypothetical protein JST50_22635 [Bacteroidetes bacterium]|jgi:nucleoside phosphorylase|nr:hypothetical protein [Bacteroidota bacterium]